MAYRVTIGDQPPQRFDLDLVTHVAELTPGHARAYFTASDTEIEDGAITQSYLDFHGGDADYLLALWDHLRAPTPRCGWQSNEHPFECFNRTIFFRDGSFWCAEHAPPMPEIPLQPPGPVPTQPAPVEADLEDIPF